MNRIASISLASVVLASAPAAGQDSTLPPMNAPAVTYTTNLHPGGHPGDVALGGAFGGWVAVLASWGLTDTGKFYGLFGQHGPTGAAKPFYAAATAYRSASRCRRLRPAPLRPHPRRAQRLARPLRHPAAVPRPHRLPSRRRELAGPRTPPA